MVFYFILKFYMTIFLQINTNIERRQIATIPNQESNLQLDTLKHKTSKGLKTININNYQ